MAKREAVKYVCSDCGAESTSWSGRCFNCGEWNTLEEKLAEFGGGSSSAKGREIKPESLSASKKERKARLATNINEVDNVLGGGIVQGSVNLIAGQPGIGKSTILLQIADSVAKKHNVLYISAEESAHQVASRASRLGVKSPKLKIASSTVSDDIAATISKKEFDLVVVDSIQAVSCNVIASAAGTVSQITNSTQLITESAKNSNTAVVIVGHVTKQGSIAGPKVLEHVVDVVMQLEGDRYGGFKVLRAVKNRYGSTNEAGIFEMEESGLQPVDNPSAALLEERQATDGSVVLATLEGSRPLLVEVQALVNRTNYGYPKRAASGIDLNRVNLLVAMLEKRTKLNLAEQDIYINIVGGIKIREPAADLAIVMAIASAAKGMQLGEGVAVFGEIGLSGEIRHVPMFEKRVAEAEKLGFKTVIGPTLKKGKAPKIYQGVKDVRSALNTYLER